MPGRLRTAAGDRPKKLRTAATCSEKFRTAAGDVPEKLRLELAELKRKCGKRTAKDLIQIGRNSCRSNEAVA